MTSRLFIAGCLLLGLTLSGCSRERCVTFEMVATSDVHGNLFPYDYMRERGTVCEGSLARVAAWLGKERRQMRGKVLYFDLGDNLQGSALTYYDRTADYSGLSTPGLVLNDLGCSASTIGNHDVEAGIPTLDKFIRTCGFPVVCANLFYRGTEATYLDPYGIIEFRGLRIAVVGMVTPYVLCKLPASAMEAMEVRGIAETAGKLIPEIRAKEHPHLIIGLLHSGYEGGIEGDEFTENEALATAFDVPGFDVIFYGHDHEAHCSKVPVCNGDSVLLINPGAYAENVAKTRVSITVCGDSVLNLSVSGTVESLSGTDADPDLLEKFAGNIETVWQYQDSVAGMINCDISGTEAICGPSALTGYLNGSMMNDGSCEISLASPYDRSVEIPAGNVTMRQLQQLYPYENSITVMMLEGSDIVRILEWSSSCWMNTITCADDTLLKLRRSTEGFETENNVFEFLTAMGIDYTVDVTKPAGQRVCVTCMSDGRPFEPERKYRVGMSSFLASGGYSRFCEAVGMSGAELRKKELFSTSADFRFHLITNLAVNKENGRTVRAEKMSNWHLVPEDMAAEALRRDVELLGGN